MVNLKMDNIFDFKFLFYGIGIKINKNISELERKVSDKFIVVKGAVN